MASAVTRCALTSPAAADARSISAAAPHSVGIPSLHPPPSRLQGRGEIWKTASYCKRLARNVVAMATGEIATKEIVTGEASAEVATTAEVASPAEGATELPDVVKTIQEAWDKLEDKYAVTSLAFAGAVALWGSAGLISAIDRLPLVPGALELVGIGYTGWFAYRNLIFKPEREALIAKVKSTYSEIIGSS